VFDERRYQLVVPELGAFDSVACAEEALRREARHARQELAQGLLEAVQGRSPAAPDEASDEPRALRPERPR
jgi:hypothetical protein